MTSTTLTAKERFDALKAQFAPAAKKENNFTKFFNFWKMEPNETAVVRFLPDANPNNPRQFLVENLTHEFKINGKKRVVACLEMYDGHGSCPACAESRKYYDEARAAGEPKADQAKGIPMGPLTKLGKKYYRKKEYLGQVVVQSSPLEYEKNEGHEYEMPIGLGTQIFTLINAAFASGDLDQIPYEFKGGYDFRITKSKLGDNANYSLSKFAPKQSDLDDDVIAKLNLYDLETLRNRRTEAATIEAMIIADKTGQPLTTDTGVASEPAESFTDSASVMAAVTTQTTPQEPSADVAIVNSPVTEAPSKVNDVLAQIRARAAANKPA